MELSDKINGALVDLIFKARIAGAKDKKKRKVKRHIPKVGFFEFLRKK